MSSTMKRSRQEFEAFNDGLASVANYLMLLSQTTAASKPPPPTDTYSGNAPHHDRIFECKTCSRQFPSFQALGGHRASHKKPKLSGPMPAQTGARSSSENSSISNDNHCYSSQPAKAKKAHECSICGAEFALGQALGGHMRRHRAAVSVGDLPSTTLSLSCRPLTEVKKAADKAVMVMVMSGGAGGGSTLCLDLCL